MTEKNDNPDTENKTDGAELGNVSGDIPAEPSIQDGKKEHVANVARRTMVGDIRDLLLGIMKDKSFTGKAWSDLKESEQKDLVHRVNDALEEAVTRAIDIIQSDGEKHIKAILKQVTVKDGFKAVFECSKHDPLAHDLIDAQGDTILIVLTNSDAYLGERNRVKFDKDQPELPVNEGGENVNSDSDQGEAGDEGDDKPDTDEEGDDFDKEAAQYT